MLINFLNVIKHLKIIDYSISGREDTVKALNNIDLNDNEEFYSIKRGEFVMIRGPSGGGKTTYLLNNRKIIKYNRNN
jgi:putative ABC transport system ATP-binding protein